MPVVVGFGVTVAVSVQENFYVVDSVLSLNRVTFAERGTYTCMAVNGSTTITADATLTVEGRGQHHCNNHGFHNVSHICSCVSILPL